MSSNCFVVYPVELLFVGILEPKMASRRLYSTSCFSNRMSRLTCSQGIGCLRLVLACSKSLCNRDKLSLSQYRTRIDTLLLSVVGINPLTIFLKAVRATSIGHSWHSSRAPEGACCNIWQGQTWRWQEVTNWLSFLSELRQHQKLFERDMADSCSRQIFVEILREAKALSCF